MSTASEAPSAALPSAPVNSASRFAHIDALRAVAVMTVLVQHSGVSVVPGDTGVTAFFAISGFIITLILLKERRRNGGFDTRRFYTRRILKIAPPFLVAIIIPTVIWASTNEFSLLAVAAQIFFSYNWVQIFDNSASGLVLPGSNVVWSLAVEEQFYIAFALLWIFLVRRTWWRRALVVVSATAIAYATTARVVLSFRGDAVEHVLRGTDVRMDGIAWGVLAAVLFDLSVEGRGLRLLRLFRGSWTPVIGLAAVAAVSVVGNDQYEAIWRNLVIAPATAAVILFGLQPTGDLAHRVIYRISGWKWVTVVGLSSYSIYIVHYVVMESVAPSLDTWPLVARSPLLLLIGLGTGLVLYQVIEKPVMRLRERRGW